MYPKYSSALLEHTYISYEKQNSYVLVELQTHVNAEKASECKSNTEDVGLANRMGYCEELAPGM